MPWVCGPWLCSTLHPGVVRQAFCWSVRVENGRRNRVNEIAHVSAWRLYPYRATDQTPPGYDRSGVQHCDHLATARNVFLVLLLGMSQVFQRRFDGSVDFYRDWADYKNGFGSTSGEFWLGNDNIHSLTSKGKHVLRIELEAFDGKTGFAEYSGFSIGAESEKYTLQFDQYLSSSTLGKYRYQNVSLNDKRIVTHITPRSYITLRRLKSPIRKFSFMLSFKATFATCKINE